MNSLQKLLLDLGLGSVECIKRIHLAFQDEITKWELMALLFLLGILAKPEEFVKLMSPSCHRVYLTPIIIDILGFSISILRSDRAQNSHILPCCMSSPSSMNMLLECKDIEIQSLRAKVIDLESEIHRHQDTIDYEKHIEDIEQLQYTDILKVYLDVIFHLERKTAEANSLYNQIENLKKDLISQNEAYSILKEQNLRLQDNQRVLYNYETEITKLRQIQSQYHQLQQTHTLAQENIKQLNDVTHELRIKLSISEAKNAQSGKIYEEMQDIVGKNLHLSEVIENYDREIFKFKAQNAKRSTLEHSIKSENKQSSFSNTPASIEQHEISNSSLYDEFQELIHSKEAEILNLKSKYNTQSVQLLTLGKQLQEASNQLSLKDEQLASYSKKIHDLQTSHHIIIKTPATGCSLDELKLRDAESDQKLNEYRRRSSDMLNPTGNYEIYSLKVTESAESKISRLENAMFNIQSDTKRDPLSTIMSVKCSSDNDSGVKSKECSTIKDWPKRCLDYLDSVRKA